MIHKFFRVIDTVVESVVILLFAVMLVVGAMQVFNRFFLGNPLTWSEEVQKYAHIWVIFLTIPICYRRGRHIGMEIITQRLPRPIQTFLAFAVDALWLFLGGAISLYIWRIMEVASWQYSPSLEIRMDYIYMGEFIGGLYLMLTALRVMHSHLTGGTLGKANAARSHGAHDDPVAAETGGPAC